MILRIVLAGTVRQSGGLGPYFSTQVPGRYLGLVYGWFCAVVGS
jgi:hypothetical protein